MRNLLLPLVLLPFGAHVLCGQGPAVTAISYDSLSHSTVRINFKTTSPWTQGHIRYIDTTTNPGGVCTDGTSGVVQSNLASNGSATFGSGAYGPYYQLVVGGLTPGHTYSFCPEVNGSRGAAYSTGGPALTITMPSLPTVHPAPPIAPNTFSTDYPIDISSYTSVTLGSGSCTHGFHDCLYAALQNQATNGSIINIPAGTDASTIGSVGPWSGEGVWPNSPDLVTFASSDVNTSTNTITHAGHGFNEGDQAIFGVSYGCLPGNATANPSNCNAGGNNNPVPFPRGVPFRIHVVDANRFQVYQCPGPTNQTGSSCSVSQGTVISFADAGNGGMRYVKYPRQLHWVIVRTATPDSQFVPPGSRVQGPPDANGVPTRPTQWVSKMGNIQARLNAAPMIGLGDQNTDPMTANVRFVGLHFSFTDTTEASASGDPFSGGAFLVTDINTQNIIFDRCYFDAPETPFRMGVGFVWNGVNTAWLGNYIVGLEGWHQTTSGLGVSGSGNTITVGSGSTSYGAGRGTLASNTTITLSGTMGSQQRLFLYFTMAGVLDVVPPPGITASVSGAANVHVVTSSGFGAGLGPALLSTGSGSTTTFPNPASTGGVNNYYIDPIASSSASCSSTGSLLAGQIVTTPPPFAGVGGGSDQGLEFTSDANQYLCGVRFFKDAADTGTHTGTLWSVTGTQLATGTFSGETASGWQTLMFSSPVAITSGTQYVVSTHSPSGWVYGLGQFRNMDLYANNMHLNGAYVSSTGSGNYNDNWPSDYLGNAAAGILGYADITTGGTVAAAGNADTGTRQSGLGNGIIAGCGPGPWMAIGNFVSGAGLPWHFDNSCARWEPRGDYTLLRNYHYGPRFSFFTTATSDGMDYTWRQPLEWKGGNRIRIYGDIFDGSVKEGGSIAMIALQSPGEVTCVTDADIMYNTFKHGPATLGGGIEGFPQACPPVRTRYSQNMSWDISSTYTVGGGGTGWLLSGQIGAEDVIIDRNTDIGRSGTKPVWWDQSEFRIEGVQVTSNILLIDPALGGLEQDSSFYQTPDACSGFSGKALADCKWTPSYVMTKNVLLPTNGATQSQIQSFYPSLTNYIPTNGAALAQGFFSVPSSFSLTSGNPDLRLKSTSPFCSGCGSPGADRRDVGADVDLVMAQQGQTTVNGVTAITATSAQVNFVAPDATGCRVDISATDSNVVNNFTSFADAGGGTDRGGNVRNIAMTGLTSQTRYWGRINCAVQQPYFQFKTQ